MLGGKKTGAAWKHILIRIYYEGFSRISAVLISSDLYNDRQVWMINDLSTVTLRSARRLLEKKQLLY